GHLKLGNLKYLYDANNITLDGPLDESMDEDVAKRFEAYGWATKTINGHDHKQIEAALDWACATNDRPVLIVCHTHIGNGAPNKHDTHKVHGEPLGDSENQATRKALGWPLDKTFYVPDEVRALWSARAEELSLEHGRWKEREAQWLSSNPDKAELYHSLRDR